MATMRLDKVLAGQGTLSRKDVKYLVWGGKVTVNGTVAAKPDLPIDPEQDVVEIEGKRMILKEHLYLMLHKPQGVVSATTDGRFPTVIDLVPPELMRKKLFPAGRLDKDTEGFVLITDDGVFAHRILAPKNKLPKQYLAVLDKPVEDSLMGEFAKGVRLSEEDSCSPAQLTVLENGPAPRVSVVIYEGMYHQIKRMFERFGYTVTYLKRQRIGNLELDPTLPMGQCRELTRQELERMVEGYLTL